jgi:hypothetical protein
MTIKDLLAGIIGSSPSFLVKATWKGLLSIAQIRHTILEVFDEYRKPDFLGHGHEGKVAALYSVSESQRVFLECPQSFGHLNPQHDSS